MIAMATMLFALTGMSASAAEVAFEKDSSLPMVYLNVAIKAGAANDPQGQSGMTNFMGEMLLRGTQLRTKEQIDLELDQMGAQLEVETRPESMIIRGAVLATQLDPFLRLLKEIVTLPKFPEIEIRKLKAQIVSAIADEVSHDQTLANRHFMRFLFHDHPYGKSVMGLTHDIQKLTPQQIRAHYDRFVRDKLILVAGTGDASESDIASWAKQVAAGRPGGEDAVLVPMPENSPRRRLLIVDKPDRTQTQIFEGQIGMRMTDERFYPTYIASHAFGGGSFNSRLMVEVRVKRGWSYGASSQFRHGRRPRIWNTYLFPASKDAAAALALTLQMVRDLQEKGITAAEFEFAQRSLVNSAGFNFNTARKRVENKLMERTLDLPDGFVRDTANKLTQVTLEDTNRAAHTFFKPDHLVITVVGTAKDLKPALIKAAAVAPTDVQVVPYTQE